jgi:UDP-glucose 4-epimerase
MKRILITGISGYLGSRLTECLAGRDDVSLIVGVDVAPMKKEYRNAVFHKTDIRSPEIADIMNDNQIDTVLHLAFVVKPVHNKKLMHDIDVNGTRNVLEAALSSGVKHVVAVSSTLAYGAHRDNPPVLTEDHPLRGNVSYPYGRNKAVVDVLMQEFARSHPEMTITILRPCTVFGPSVDNYVSRMLFMPVVVSIYGYDPEVQLVHEDDFVSACLLAMDKKIPGAFNIAGDGTLCASAIAAMIGTTLIPLPKWFIYPLLELLWRLRMPGIEVNSGYLDYIRYPFVASTLRAARDLAFKPKHTTLETLDQTIRSRKERRSSGKKEETH